MTDPADVTDVTAWRAAAGVPLEVLREHRAAMDRYARPPDAPGPPETLADPARGDAILRPGGDRFRRPRPAEAIDLPPAVQELVRDWEAAHPGARLEPVRLVAFGTTGSTPTGVTDLPPDEALVALSISRTQVTAQEIEVDGFLLLARRTDVPA
ncbi:MAG: hypothetical protein ABWY33_01505 [Cellulomonas sp.]